MMRLIDADELIEHMFLGTEYDKTVDDGMEKTEAMCKAFKCGWNDALASVIDYAPTVDAVPLEDYKSMERTVNKLTKALADAEPVVRCKDCKFYDKGNCNFWDDGYGAIVSSDDYCSQGKKMDEVTEDV